MAGAHFLEVTAAVGQHQVPDLIMVNACARNYLIEINIMMKL